MEKFPEPEYTAPTITNEEIADRVKGPIEASVGRFTDNISSNIEGSFENDYESGCKTTVGYISEILGAKQKEVIFASKEMAGGVDINDEAVIVPALDDGEELSEDKKIDLIGDVAYKVWFDAHKNDSPLMEEDDAHQPWAINAKKFAEQVKTAHYISTISATFYELKQITSSLKEKQPAPKDEVERNERLGGRILQFYRAQKLAKKLEELKNMTDLYQKLPKENSQDAA